MRNVRRRLPLHIKDCSPWSLDVVSVAQVMPTDPREMVTAMADTDVLVTFGVQELMGVHLMRPWSSLVQITG
jgi:hypothetical protein